MPTACISELCLHLPGISDPTHRLQITRGCQRRSSTPCVTLSGLSSSCNRNSPPCSVFRFPPSVFVNNVWLASFICCIWQFNKVILQDWYSSRLIILRKSNAETLSQTEYEPRWNVHDKSWNLYNLKLELVQSCHLENYGGGPCTSLTHNGPLALGTLLINQWWYVIPSRKNDSYL